MGRREAGREVIVVERGGASFWWLLAGGAVGAALALLLAPQSGEKTRQQLGLKIAKLKESAEAAIDDFKDAVDPLGVPDEVEVDAAPDDGASPARRELEKRLAAARAKRRRTLADQGEDEDEEPVA